MKKLISITLTISLILSTFTLASFASKAENTIADFINGTTRLIEEYDSNKKFIAEENITETEIISEATIDETEDLTDFQTCRLIVQTDYDFDTYNAIDVVSGFQNFHILQFENESDTQAAYEKYVNNSNIISVDIDRIFKGFDEDVYENWTESTPTREDFETCWSLNAIGMDVVLTELSNHKFSEIIVGIIDTGIDYNHEIFENRVVRTYFNNSGDGEENDEYDVHGHGTRSASIVVKNSPENVKVAAYRMGTSDGNLTVTAASAAILKALNDNVRIINCSFSFFYYDDNALIYETLEYARSLNCFVAASSGNTGYDSELNPTAFHKGDNAMVVASSNSVGLPTDGSTFGKYVDIIAPGDNVYGAAIGNNYDIVSGTSFSAPCIAGIYATLSSVHPELSLQEKERRLVGSTVKSREPFLDHFFPNGGIINALDLFNLNELSSPIFSMDSGIYNGMVSVELTAEPGCDIYYTMDCTYPSPTNGVLYTKPIEFVDDDFAIIAVAYKNGKRSNFSWESIHAAEIGTDNMFTITEDGMITEYFGDSFYLKIPEVINGITVTDIAPELFSTANLEGLVLPDTMTFIGNMKLFGGPEHDSCIKGNPTIKYISGKNVKIIGQKAFYQCESLREVYFPKCEEIAGRAFYNTNLIGIDMPSVTAIHREAFYQALFLREIILPNCTKASHYTINRCRQLKYVYLPLIDYNTNLIDAEPGWQCDYTKYGVYDVFNYTNLFTELDLPNMIAFGRSFETPRKIIESSINRLEFSKIQYLYSLPCPGDFYYGYIEKPIPVELSLPSSLVYCAPIDNFIDETQREYCVYGTKGTYAEQWAIENNITFYEITQETAIVENIEPFWDEYSYKPLEFDARGFNRTYQWYGSTDDIIGNDTPIIGATDKTFNPDDNKQYPYYYCVMNSKDIDVDGNIVSEVNITSDICQNRLHYIYNIDKTSIDYSNLMIYTQTYAQTNIDNIVGIKETTTYYYRPSYIYRKVQYYGTGSSLDVCNDNGVWETYTLIVQGDINGDSVCDVIDAFEVQRASTDHTELTDNYLLAADTDFDGKISVQDYAQVVNMAINN